MIVNNVSLPVPIIVTGVLISKLSLYTPECTRINPELSRMASCIDV